MNTAALQLDIAPTPLETESLAAFYKAAGDPLRLSILRLLHRNDYGVLELCLLLDIKQPSMSHHLKVLANAGLVVTRRDGNSIYYRRAASIDSPTKALQEHLFRSVDLLPIPERMNQLIATINDERSRASREFFQQNADRFQTNQDLIASYMQYGVSITEFLDATPVQHNAVLEVGPGEGYFLADLSSRFNHVVALDNSEEMLERSRIFATQKPLNNVQFIFGDTGTALASERRFDCITLNMVLHHTPDPAHVCYELAQLLNPGGALLVTELCPHSQHWARESCGDLWLGFDPEDITRWADEAGLVAGESLYLTQRNGFQIQLRQFFNPR